MEWLLCQEGQFPAFPIFPPKKMILSGRGWSWWSTASLVHSTSQAFVYISHWWEGLKVLTSRGKLPNSLDIYNINKYILIYNSLYIYIYWMFLDIYPRYVQKVMHLYAIHMILLCIWSTIHLLIAQDPAVKRLELRSMDSQSTMTTESQDRFYFSS